MKEPFFLGGLRDEGVLDACLRTLTVPLIDRRRLVKERLAYQIAADPYRLDVGNPMLTTEELVAWGLAKPDDAQTLVRRLIEASEIERQLLLEAPSRESVDACPARAGRRPSATTSAGCPATPRAPAAPSPGCWPRRCAPCRIWDAPRPRPRRRRACSASASRAASASRTSRPG
ncbi:MAG: hypothetical protein R3E53_14670 [Myxococcota bacterium]